MFCTFFHVDYERKKQGRSQQAEHMHACRWLSFNPWHCMIHRALLGVTTAHRASEKQNNSKVPLGLTSRIWQKCHIFSLNWWWFYKLRIGFILKEHNSKFPSVSVLTTSSAHIYKPESWKHSPALLPSFNIHSPIARLFILMCWGCSRK